LWKLRLTCDEFYRRKLRHEVYKGRNSGWFILANDRL